MCVGGGDKGASNIVHMYGGNMLGRLLALGWGDSKEGEGESGQTGAFLKGSAE